MKPQGYIPPSASPSAHEASDLNVPLLARMATILAGTLVILVGLSVLLFRHFDHVYPQRTSEAAPVVTAAELPPAPRLQTKPRQDLLEVRAAEDRHLNGYMWVDRQQGIAQIPVDRAMKLWVTSYAAPTNAVSSETNTAPASTELQMRQQKAMEASHAP